MRKYEWPFIWGKFRVIRKKHRDEAENERKLNPIFPCWVFIKLLMRMYNITGL